MNILRNKLNQYHPLFVPPPQKESVACKQIKLPVWTGYTSLQGLTQEDRLSLTLIHTFGQFQGCLFVLGGG